MAAPGYAELRARHGLAPFSLTGRALTAYVREQVVRYRGLAAELGLRVAPARGG